ncbi:hypothetical protein PIB30_025881 [Stylosanthes scabra]|uniref:RRM domain-containing protein n=1 Tax=Stylosanthes scabra TaxID=79078 RepID=A0ABU6XBZ8_9FABA|nr:hypothetical protein [Stylosanthes scabra]
MLLLWKRIPVENNRRWDGKFNGVEGDGTLRSPKSTGENVNKGILFELFGRVGEVADVYVSWKKMRDRKCPFAFIRFDSTGGARRAVDRMHGTLVYGRSIEVTLAKYCRGDQNSPNGRVDKGGVNETQVMGMKDATGISRTRNNERRKEKTREIKEVKEIEVKPCEMQIERLQRSLMGHCFKSINFPAVMSFLEERWDGKGEVECRDVGPKRCLLTFESTETRDIAFHDALLLSIFDELRLHWEFVRCLSRRV